MISQRAKFLQIVTYLILLAPIHSNCSSLLKKEMVQIKKKPSQASVQYNQSYMAHASWYGIPFHKRLTASGEVFDMFKLTAAHKTLPFNTLVKVTNIENNETIVVRINDRGPYIPGRDIDLSYGAARRLGMIGSGVTKVRLQLLISRKTRPYKAMATLRKKPPVKRIAQLK